MVEQFDHSGGTAHHGEVPAGHRAGGATGRVEPPLPSGQPVKARRHVVRAGDGPDHPAAAVDQVFGRCQRSADVVHVDVVARAEAGPGRTPTEDQRHSRVQRGQGGVGRMLGDHECAVDRAMLKVLARLGFGVRARHHEREQMFAAVQPGHDPLDHQGEVRVTEEAADLLGHEQGDRVRPPRGTRAPVRHVVEPDDGRVDCFHDLGPDVRSLVDHPGHGGSTHPGRGSDRFQRRLGPRRARTMTRCPPALPWAPR